MQRRRAATGDAEGGRCRIADDGVPRRRPEVLDSSDEDEDDRGVRGRSRGRVSVSVGGDDALSQSSTSVMENLSRTGLARAMSAFDGIDIGNGERDDDGASDDDDDGELMNPYVMNPFPDRPTGTTAALDAAALLPPSIELAAPSGGFGGGGAPSRQTRPPLQPRLTDLDDAAAPRALSPLRTTPREALASFDPYGSADKDVAVQELRGRPSPHPEMEMEMEEELIEFVPNAEQTDGKAGQGLNIFGPLVDEPLQPGDSFPPFPKRQSGRTAGEYGEATPLSPPGGSAAKRGRRPRAAPSGMRGILGALVDVLRAVVSSAAHLATSLLYRDQLKRSNNPFSDPRRLRKRWGMASCFRLLAASLGALFCAGTVTVIYTASRMDDAGASVASKAVYQKDARVVDEGQREEASHRPSSIVLKKKGEGKRRTKGRRGRWWNRGGAESGAAGGGQPHTEVYHNGEEQSTAQEVAPQESSSSNKLNQDDQRGPGGNAVETLPVIVQTEEDGTILIKLPPPAKDANTLKERAEQPMGAAENPPALGNDLAGDGEETMYIKLPYPQPQQQQHRTLTELAPPPRGAAVGGHLTRHPPPPLAESHRHHTHTGGYHSHQDDRSTGLLNSLRAEFDSWVTKHGKEYANGEEKEHRFYIWRRNHLRIQEKNQKHGPCRMTGKAVFGHNLFSDLDPEEFQSRFLTGYHGPRAGVHNHNNRGHKKKGGNSHFRERKNVSQRKMAATKDRPPPVKRHPSIQRKLEEHTATYGGGGSRLNGSKYQSSFLHGCSWWDVSCVLRWIFSYQYVGGTREPVYDENSYPSALDWRSMGVVTDVHSQGSCGACWAITAVETIESAYAIANGQLIDLSEEEVIACDGTCEMCNGGWPQNAYEYVMKHGGLPEKTSDYDADWLYTITAVLSGESDEASEYDMGYYFAGVCPSGSREGDNEGSGSGSRHSGSGDGNQYYYDVSYVETTRYGKIKGYGYSTDRCICYTDGSGCDCDDQDEKTAVLNVASYGPAAVCLEASLWQDYEGGIMTSDIGCSSSFLDMNHCVEVVGYAFTDGSSGGNEEGDDGNDRSGSGSGSNDRSNSGSRDGGDREGYWIVKNQWSNYWGMNGYAYVAMGGNTCGILNDMTQVYMD